MLMFWQKTLKKSNLGCPSCFTSPCPHRTELQLGRKSISCHGAVECFSAPSKHALGLPRAVPTPAEPAGWSVPSAVCQGLPAGARAEVTPGHAGLRGFCSVKGSFRACGCFICSGVTWSPRMRSGTCENFQILPLQ